MSDALAMPETEVVSELNTLAACASRQALQSSIDMINEAYGIENYAQKNPVVLSAVLTMRGKLLAAFIAQHGEALKNQNPSA